MIFLELLIYKLVIFRSANSRVSKGVTINKIDKRNNDNAGAPRPHSHNFWAELITTWIAVILILNPISWLICQKLQDPRHDIWRAGVKFYSRCKAKQHFSWKDPSAVRSSGLQATTRPRENDWPTGHIGQNHCHNTRWTLVSFLLICFRECILTLFVFCRWYFCGLNTTVDYLSGQKNKPLIVRLESSHC
jgi:hypothetical protein